MWGQPPPWTPGSGAGPPPPVGGWSMDPNHYSQIPHQQVDWASLAQQWIQMKGTDVLQQPTPSVVPPSVLVHPQQHTSAIDIAQQHHQDVIGEAPMDLDESAGQSEHAIAGGLYTRSSSTLPSSQIVQLTNPGIQLRSHSPIKGHLTSHILSQKPLQPWLRTPFHEGQKDEAQSLGMHPESQFIGDENPALALRNNYAHHNTWTQNQSSLDVNSFNNRGKQYNYSKNTNRKQSYQEEEPYEEDLEAARRRALPSWIREGLEKVEREKRKAEEKERMQAAREEERRLRRMRDHQDLEINDSDQSEESTNPKVKGSVNQNDEPLTISLKGFLRQQPLLPQLTLEEILASLSKDEQTEQVMMSVRRQLTQILLDVTNTEMRVVAQEALERAKTKQKVTSSRGQCLALTSLTGGPLGLGDYGSDSDDQDDEDDEGAPEVDSEGELIAEMERKKRNYEIATLFSDDEGESEEKSSTTAVSHDQNSTPRSRSKSTETKSNGKFPDPPTKSVSVPEKRRGDESKVDVKKSERRRSHSIEKQRRRRRSSRSQSSSRTKSTKRDKSKSKSRERERRRRRSRSKKRDRRHRSRSISSTTTKSKKRSRSRSRSKTRKIEKSRSRRSKSSSTTSRNRKKSRSKSKDRKNEKSSRRRRSISSSSTTRSSSRSNSVRRQTQRHRR